MVELLNLLKGIFLVFCYLIGILAAAFFTLFLLIIIIKLWKGRV